jgi:hypothetical protein
MRGLSAAPEPVMWVDVYYWKVSTSRFINICFDL